MLDRVFPLATAARSLLTYISVEFDLLSIDFGSV